MRSFTRECLLVFAACAALASGCSRDPMVPQPSEFGGGDFAIGQPRKYFLSKWGDPVGTRDNTWNVDGLTATVRFSYGEAAVITYTTPGYDWTDDQIRAALEANGSGWKQVQAAPGESLVSEFTQGILRWFGAPSRLRYISAEGTQARVFTNTLTVESATQIALEGPGE